MSILPFRDRPFIQFADGNIAPIHPALVVEKLTYDLFWWSGTPDKKQDHPWQRDWGDLVEAYVVKVLRWIASETGCGFAADVQWDGKQIDAAMWFKGHVALFEISAAMLTEAAAHGGEADQLRDGLMQSLVRSKKTGGKSKDEALVQVARDAKALLMDELKEQIPIDPVTRVYPVVIAIDRGFGRPGCASGLMKCFRRRSAPSQVVIAWRPLLSGRSRILRPLKNLLEERTSRSEGHHGARCASFALGT